MADVFISYSRTDKNIAEQLAVALEAAGISSWLDQHLQGGSTFTDVTEQELVDAASVVVLWTDTSVKSNWVKDEAQVGREQGKLVPLLIDGTLPPLGFRQIQAIDFTNWPKDTVPFGALTGALQAIMGDANSSLIVSDESAPPALPSRKSLIMAGMAAITLAVAAAGGLGYWVWGGGLSGSGNEASAEQADAKSIAILPFRDLSAESQSWFSDGLAQEISAALSRTPDLKVAPIAESFRFRERQQSMSDIGGELGVARVLDGSVRRSEDRIVVDIELIDAQSGDRLFTQRYDRPLADTITVQEEIATRVARALNTALDPAALAELIDSGTNSVEAYEAFLRAQGFTFSGEDGNGQASLEQYRRAQELDPSWSRAHIAAASNIVDGLSLASFSYINDADRAALSAEFDRNIEAAERTARSASERDTALYLRHYFSGDLNAALRVITRNTERAPEDADSWRTKGNLEDLLGRNDAAAASAARASALEPDRPHLNINNLYDARAYDEAEALYDATPADHRGSMLFLYQSHRVLLSVGRVEEAARLAREIRSYEPSRDSRMIVDIRQACAQGDRAGANALMDIEAEYANTQWQALMYLGRTEEAVEVMRPYDFAEAPFPLLELLSYPFFDPRPYPNLMAVMARQNIPVPDRLFFNPPACPPAKEESV
uniref:TIR domain-containing protein n=1 Tax=Parerythrobacter lutipelagi TaxID=1964208 RepID=UPI001375912D|nr:TIR domain-containing protein [Parerythrobacter lutipelagi]